MVGKYYTQYLLHFTRFVSGKQKNALKAPSSDRLNFSFNKFAALFLSGSHQTTLAVAQPNVAFHDPSSGSRDQGLTLRVFRREEGDQEQGL